MTNTNSNVVNTGLGIHLANGVGIEIGADDFSSLSDLRLGTGTRLDPFNLDPFILNPSSGIITLTANSEFQVSVTGSAFPNLGIVGIQFLVIDRQPPTQDWFSSLFDVSKIPFVKQNYDLNTVYIEMDGATTLNTTINSAGNNPVLTHNISVSVLLSFPAGNLNRFARIDPIVKISTGG